MIVIKISTLILLFAVHSVSSNDSENLQKFKYKFNHPPQSKSYQSIPVAIVYDEPESNNLKLAEKATTYRPRLKLDAITGANMYDEISSIDEGDFSEEEERQVKQLTNLLRKTTLRSRANILSDDVTEFTTTLQADLEDTSVNVIGFESTEKSNTVYKEMDRNKLREKTVSLSVSSGESINESLITAKVEQTYLETVNLETTKRINTLQEEAHPAVKEIEGSEKPQPINRGRQKGQRVRPRDQTEASPSIAKDESSITPVKNEQSDRKTTRRRGSIKYKNYEQYSTATTQKNTNTIPKFTTEEVEENYPKNTPYLNKPISEKSLSSPERENYPSSEQPQLTNNRPGPRNTKPRVQNFVTTTNAGEESTDRVMIRGYSEEQSYQVPQRDQQRVRYLSHSVVNVVGTDTKIKPSSISEPQKYPTTQKPGTSEKISIQQRTKEGIYFEPPTVSLKLKTNKRTTTRQPILTTTEEENYPKLPIVPLQKQLKTNEKSTTLRSLTTIDEENNPQFSSVSQTNEKVTLDPLSTTEDINYSELDINEAITIQPTVTTEEENYPKTVKPLTQYKGEVTNVQFGSTRQQNIYPSTLSPQNSYLQRKHEDVQVQNEVSVPENIDGRVITLKSSFDVATTSSSSLFKPNNKVKVIYKVQNAETTSEDMEEMTTLPSMTEENSEPTSETVKATEKPFIYENEFIHKQNGSRSHFQTQNATNLPPTTAEEIISTSETVKETEKPFINKNDFRPQLYGGKNRSHNQNAINLPSTLEEIISTSETVETTEKPFVYENELKPKQFGGRSHFQNQNATNVVPSITEEIISTSETVETTKKPFVYENEFKPQTHGSRSHFQNQNGLQIPVSVVYDNTDAYLPDNQRKILRTKSEPAKNSFNVRKEPVNDFHESPKTGNVTENLNVEKRTRGRKPVVPILNSENHIYAQTGKFNYRYESGDGTKNFQQGILKPFDDDVTGESVKGGFSYTDKDGNDFSVSYTADENGYRPVGRHLPTPPPIPPAIARALAHLATKSSPDPDEVTESSIDEH